MKRPHDRLGPWAISLESGSRLELSAFWKRRMQSIADFSSASHRLGRRALAGAVVAAALLTAAPLVDFAPADAAAQDDPAEAAAADAAPAGKFVARFSNGVELELIGVSSSPSALESWRTPDGQPMAAPYIPIHRIGNGWKAPMLREFCWRWRGADSPDIHTSWNVEEDTRGWGPVQPGDADGNLIKDLTAFVVPFTVIRPSCTLRFTMSHPGSKWQPYWQGQGGHVSANVMHPPGQEVTGVTFDKPRSMDGGTFVVMGYKFPDDQDARLIAVDSDGKRHVGKGESAGGMMGFRQLAVSFPGLQPQHIKDWVVEKRTRVTEIVAFHNLSLDPETRTLVQIVGPGVVVRASGGGATLQPPTALDRRAKPPEFGPIVEAIVNGDPAAHEGLIDFDAGNVFRAENVDSEAAGMKWLVDHGVDAAAQVESHFVGLLGFDMIAVPTERDNWEAPEKLPAHLSGATAGTPVPMDGGGDLPATFFFQTREGARGVLQIVEVIPDEAVKIRYKLAKPQGEAD